MYYTGAPPHVFLDVFYVWVFFLCAFGQNVFCWFCCLATTGGGSSKAGGARKASDPSPSGAQAPQHSPDHLRWEQGQSSAANHYFISLAPPGHFVCLLNNLCYHYHLCDHLKLENVTFAFPVARLISFNHVQFFKLRKLNQQPWPTDTHTQKTFPC